MAFFKTPAEKAEAEYNKSQALALKKEYDDKIKAAKEAEKTSQNAYKLALETGDNEKIKNSIDNMKKTEEDTKRLEQDKKDALSPKTTEHKVDKKSSTQRPFLSESFYRDVHAAISKRPGGNTLDAAHATANAQGQNQLNESANRQMEAQASQQVANRNEFAEAGKTASMQNSAENKQNINNLSAAAGTAAALQRKTNTPDVHSQQARQDQQRSIANQRREEADKAQQGATESFGQSAQFKLKSRDFDDRLDTSRRLSMGEGSTGEDVESDTDKNTNENTGDTSTENNTPDSQIVGNPQHLLNYITYGDESYLDDNDKKLLEAWGNPQPLDSATIKAAKGNKGILQQNVMSMRPDFWKKYAASDLGKARKVGTASQLNLGNGITQSDLANAKQTVDVNDVNSDERIKNVQKVLSDCRMKHIKEDYEAGDGITPEDFMWLAKVMGGKYTHDGREYDFFNSDDWNDDEDGSVLKGYAEHIRNYLYTYKPEATEIDPNIDPDEEHIGPMAQDIELVNPACVKETSDGTKTVDTARLAMMNAGAIGDLARQLQELIDKLKELGI